MPDLKTQIVAVIDLGTNTFHLLIIETGAAGAFRIIDKVKEPVKLGEGAAETGAIAPEAFERGLAALEKFSGIIAAKKAARVLAYGTSAIRSARNGPEFVAAARARSGIEIQAINGNEEASLIYEGIRYGLPLPVHDDVLMVDIGGGSVEFVVGNKLGAKLLRSLRVGAARMLARVAPDDPIPLRQQESVKTIYREEMRDLLPELREFKLRKLIGSSGSYETLGTLAAHDAGEKILKDYLNGYKVSPGRFAKIHERLMSSNRAERLKMPGMEELRVDMILMGSLLTDLLIEELGLEEIIVSEYALKEGMLVHYLKELRAEPEETADANQREQAVVRLAERFGCSLEKGRFVSRLALSIFDQTRFLHGFGPLSRELLHYACLLVDAGHLINRSSHHKHGQYIIQNSGLPGFSSKELLVLGNLVRYHRKSLPSSEHWHFNVLYKDDKDIVEKMGGILRLAVNLNRSNRQLVSSVTLDYSEALTTLRVQTQRPAEYELESAEKVRELFERAFGTRLEILPIS